jgi:prevent-host-death family protein
MSANDNATFVSLTDFHHKPGAFIDSSQLQPVALTKRNRPYAYVVSAAFFEQAAEALAALHGHRQVVTADELDPETDRFLSEFGPSSDEIASDAWGR